MALLAMALASGPAVGVAMVRVAMVAKRRVVNFMVVVLWMFVCLG